MTGVTCRGSYLLGTACGHCDRCRKEREELQQKSHAASSPLLPDSARKVFKYPLSIQSGIQQLMLPRGAAVLHVGQQEGGLQLWALCAPAAPLEKRHFIVAGTGWLLHFTATPQSYLGTVQSDSYVWHVFEVWPETGDHVV